MSAPTTASFETSAAGSRSPSFHAGNGAFWAFLFVISLPANFTTLESRVHAVLVNFCTISTAWALCYGLWAFYRRLPPPGSTSGLRFFANVAFACVAGGSIWSIISFITSMAILGPQIYDRAARLSSLYLGLPILIGMFLAWSGLYLGFRHWQILTFERREKARAELATLRQQIQPHFLFNALNTIRADMSEAPARAGNAMDSLSEYLHYLSTQPADRLISVREELAGVRAYLEIIGSRFGNAVQCEVFCQTECRDLPMPPFCIQPIVENAIKHGAPHPRKPMRIEISVSSQNGEAVATIRNTGSWKRGGTSGTGIANLEKRLRYWFGRETRLRIGEKNGWVSVDIPIPTTSSPTVTPLPG